MHDAGEHEARRHRLNGHVGHAKTLLAAELVEVPPVHPLAHEHAATLSRATLSILEEEVGHVDVSEEGHRRLELRRVARFVTVIKLFEDALSARVQDLVQIAVPPAARRDHLQPHDEHCEV